MTHVPVGWQTQPNWGIKRQAHAHAIAWLIGPGCLTQHPERITTTNLTFGRTRGGQHGELNISARLIANPGLNHE